MYKSRFRQKQKRSRSPAGPRRRRKRTHAIGVHPLPPAVLSVAISLAAQDRAVAEGGKGPCFAVCALVCHLSPKAECVPAFTHESERGAFVPEVLKTVWTMCWKCWYDCVSCAFHGFFEDEKGAGERGGVVPTPTPATSAHSAGSFRLLFAGS